MEKMMQAILAIDDDYEISICPMLRASGLYYRKRFGRVGS
jgi:hypothetical protein